MKRIVVFALCATIVPMAMALNPVTVDGTGAGDFLTIQDAVESWCTGGANAAETPPFVIDVVAAAGPYDEALTLNSADTASGSRTAGPPSSGATAQPCWA